MTFMLGFLFTILGPDRANRQGSYLMAVPDNYLRLTQSQDTPQRIVFLGGSSMGWGVSAEYIEQELGIPALNLGVHAGIGYKNILSLYQDYLSPDRDIIVVSPEYSMVSAGSGLTRTYCDVLYLTQAFSGDAFLCGPRNLFTNLKDIVLSPSVDENSLYQRSGFNSHGDYTHVYDLPNQGGFSSGEILDTDKDDAAISEYHLFLRGLTDSGFRVVYAPTTLAEKSCRGTEDVYYALNVALADRLPILFDEQFPFCAPDQFFVNTSYHPNREGMIIKTNAVLQILRNELEE